VASPAAVPGSGDDHEKGAVQYEQARNRLLQFFAARGKLGDEELADATFDRVVAKLSDETAAQVRCPVGYMLRFAHFIYLEHIKSEISRRNRLAAIQPDEADAWRTHTRVDPEPAARAGRGMPQRAPAGGAYAAPVVLHARRPAAHRRPPEDEPRARNHAGAAATRVSRLLSAFNRRVRTLAEEAALA